MGEIKDPYEAIRKLKKRFREQEGDIFEKEVGVLTASGPKQPAGKKVSPIPVKPAGKVPLAKKAKAAPIKKGAAAKKSVAKKAGKKKSVVPKKKKKR